MLRSRGVVGRRLRHPQSWCEAGRPRGPAGSPEACPPSCGHPAGLPDVETWGKQTLLRRLLSLSRSGATAHPDARWGPGGPRVEAFHVLPGSTVIRPLVRPCGDVNAVQGPSGHVSRELPTAAPSPGPASSAPPSSPPSPMTVAQRPLLCMGKRGLREAQHLPRRHTARCGGGQDLSAGAGRHVGCPTSHGRERPVLTPEMGLSERQTGDSGTVVGAGSPRPGTGVW